MSFSTRTIKALTIIAVLALSSCGLYKKTVRESEHNSSAEHIATGASLSEVTTASTVGTSDRITWTDVTEDNVMEFTAEGNVAVAPDGTVTADRVKGRTAGTRKDNSREPVREALSGQTETAHKLDREH